MEEKIFKIISQLEFENAILKDKAEQMEEIDKNAYFWYNGQIKKGEEVIKTLKELLK